MSAFLRGGRGVAIALVATLLVHLPVLWNGFTYDDNHVARAEYGASQNPLIAELRPIGEYFGSEYWTGVGQLELASNPLYRPVPVLSFAVTHAIWPGEPEANKLGPATSEAFPHRLLNLLLQLAAVGLVYALVIRVGGSDVAAAVGALVFGLHAQHTEVVATCVGRADLFAFVFGLGALLVWLRGQATDGRARLLRFGASAVLLFLAFCSKESALPWIGAFPLFGMLAQRSVAASFVSSLGRQLGWTVAVAVLPFVAWYWLRASAFAGIPDDWHCAYVTNPYFHGSWAERVPNAIKIWGYGLYQSLVPLQLACDWGPEVFSRVETLTDLGFLASAAMLVLLWGVALVSIRRQPMVFVAVAIWTGFSLPTSNVLFPVGTLFAERLYYAPSLGVSVAFAWLVLRCERGTAANVVIAILLAWCVGSGVRTFVRCRDWKDNTTLFLGDAERQPRSLMLLGQAAQSSAQEDREDRWRSYLERQIEVQPEFASSYVQLAHKLIEQSKFDEAQRMLERADSAKIKHLRADVAAVHFERGLLYMFTQRSKAALVEFQRCLEASPRNPKHRHQIIAGGIGSFDDAVLEQMLAEGERLQPEEASWGFLRGMRAFAKRDYENAVTHWDATIERASPAYGRHVWQAWLDYAQSLARVARIRYAKEILGRLLGHPEFDDERLRKDAKDMLRILQGG